VSLKHEGGAVRIPPHLAELVESVTPEHRECVEELNSDYCLRAIYPGRVAAAPIDLDAILEKCAGPPTAH
jgi:hypothetical protein